MCLGLPRRHAVPVTASLDQRRIQHLVPPRGAHRELRRRRIHKEIHAAREVLGLGVVEAPTEAPVHHHHLAQLAGHEVVGLDIAVNDAATMRVRHRLTHARERVGEAPERPARGRLSGHVSITQALPLSGGNINVTVTGQVRAAGLGPITQLVALSGTYQHPLPPPSLAILTESFDAHFAVDARWQGRGGFS